MWFGQLWPRNFVFAWQMDRVVDCADRNSKGLVKYRSREEVRQAHPQEDVAIIHIDGVGNVFDHMNHERGKWVVEYLKQMVLPRMETDASGFYPISYDDACGYPGVLCFSKRRGDASVLLPDLYQMTDYSLTQKIYTGDVDVSPKEDNRIFFTGASTGSLVFEENERVNACLWSKDNPDISSFTLSNVVQMVPDKVLQSGICSHTFVPRRDQLRHKYLLSIDGNTAAWDRPVWIMQSNSLLLKMESSNWLWYYDFLVHCDHMVSVPHLNCLRGTWTFLESNPKFCNHVLHNAHHFVNTYCLSDVHATYAARVIGNAQGA